MKTSRFSRMIVSVCLAACFPVTCLVQSCSLTARQHDHALTRIHPMHELRASHTATVLPDGSVLIAGGFKKGPDGHSQIYYRSAELFDPATKSFVLVGEMNVARAGHTATLLANGKVLLAGGFTDEGITAAAELYDPVSKLFTPVGNMLNPRGGSTATLLTTGDVLIAGGGDVDAVSSAELFHPATNQFSATGAMTVPRQSHTATLLPGGRVLVVGGGGTNMVLASAELYDPATGTFASAGTMSLPRYKHAAVLLKDGHTLILGGSDERDWRGTYCSAEIYDWRSGKFTPIPAMADQRFKFPCAVAQFGSGNILVCGGSKTVELFDFLLKRFRAVAEFDHPYYYSTASLLNNGTVLIVGGYTDTIQSTNAAWIFKTQ